MNISTYFDNIFIINLDHRADKWKLVTSELNKVGITKYERFSAIKPNLEDVSEIYKKNIAARNNSDGPDETYIVGVMGCKLSHIEVIKLAKERHYKRVLVLEDDVAFRKDATHIFTNAVQQLSTLPTWHMIYFTGNHGNRFTKVAPNLIKLRGSHSTVGYGASERIYDEIIDNAYDYPYHIDLFYKDKIHPKFACYCIMPHLVWNVNGYSDIEQGYRDYRVLKKHL